ncbi:MAG: trigger factor family protein [Saprospiraceae bacterium]|nr:trigger factor family protein [Saprospiraceae bacterium]
MDIQKKDLGQGISQISITLEPADYAKKFDQELQKVAGKAAIKGFRKGKCQHQLLGKCMVLLYLQT